MIGIALLLLTVVAALPVAVLVVQLLAARPALLHGAGGDLQEARAGRVAVLMPAHNEAAGIRPAIAAVLAQLRPGDRLLVVADNCADDTASIARAAGAEVTERSNQQLRGKGYALDFGVRHLESAPPDMVAIVDADCIVAPGALERLAIGCERSARPTQALYLMHAPSGAGAKTRVAEFAWLVKNMVRPLGGAALGWPCQLMGTGMMFSWATLRDAPLATGHLVEDMQLGLDLAAAGTPPQFCAQALVSSTFPSDADGTRAQRTRWEHGHLSVIATVGPRLLWRALSQANARLFFMALDLVVPPLASLVLALVALWLAAVACAALGGTAAPLIVATLALGLLAAAIVTTWRRFGRNVVTLRDLMTLPSYVAAKIPVYVRLFTKRQVEWVRTKRDGQNH